jgi:tRNA G18 (ribose-2'-O)-methylase SpoU
MKKSANNIGKKKWLSLNSRQQHTAIAAFAAECLEKYALKKFRDFYDQVMRWSHLDRFEPPPWLSGSEVLQNFFFFHQKLSGKPPHFFKKDTAPPVLTWKARNPVTVALDQVLTPYNFGSVLRVMDNFGFERIVHSTAHLHLSHPQLKKAARGTEDWIPVQYEKDLPEFFRSAKRPVIGLEKTAASIPIHEWLPPEAFILVLGNEAYGISEGIIECCDQLVHIPMWGYKNSMNLSHALAAAAFFINSHR